MNGLLHVSEAATLGLHAMAFLVLANNRQVSAREIAGALDISAAHLAKVMQKLERAGLVASKRGPSGGFLLKTKPQTLTLKEIYEVLEGPIRDHACLLGKAQCSPDCPLGSLLHSSSRYLQQQLAQVKLSDFARNCGIRI